MSVKGQPRGQGLSSVVLGLGFNSRSPEIH